MPEIQTTLGALVEAEGALQRLAAHRLPVKSAYHLAKLCRLVQPELRLFYEQRLGLVKELGTDASTTPTVETWRVNPERMAEFAARISDLIAIPVTIPWDPFDLSTVAVEISAEDVLALGPLITLTTEAENKP